MAVRLSAKYQRPQGRGVAAALKGCLARDSHNGTARCVKRLAQLFMAIVWPESFGPRHRLRPCQPTARTPSDMDSREPPEAISMQIALLESPVWLSLGKQRMMFVDELFIAVVPAQV